MTKPSVKSLLNSTKKGKPYGPMTACSSCGSSDARQVYINEDNGSLNSFCFSCRKFDPMNQNNDNKVRINDSKPMRMKMKISDIHSLPSHAIPNRGISAETVERFGVKLGYSEVDRSITHHYYPDTLQGKVVGYEARECANKKFSSVGDRKGELDLWGQSIAPASSRKLWITEGRLDAMTLYQTIMEHTPQKYKDNLPAVVSLTRGCSTGLQDIINNRKFVDGYDQVILCLDNDKPGKDATKLILKTFPQFTVANFGKYKDPNEMLLDKKSRDLYQSVVWDSKHLRLGEVVEVTDELIEEALVRPKVGLTYPWPTLTKLTYGIRPNSIVILGAAPKQGKSEFKNQLVHHLSLRLHRKVGVYDLEMHPIKTLKQIASKEAKCAFLKPDNNYSDHLLKSTLMKLRGLVSLYDRTGSRDWEDIRVAMEEQHIIDGVCEFFIDPLTALVSRFSASEANDALNEILTDMSDFVHKYPVSIFAFSHLNPKQKGSKSHEEGGKVLSSEFTGSRALEKWSSLGLGIERNRSDDCPVEERNHSKVKILYDRDFGNHGSVDMFYNTETTEYLEPTRWT